MKNNISNEKVSGGNLMDRIPGRGVIYVVAAACIFIILFGIRGSAYILNPILLAAVITITVLPIPGRLKKRGLPGWLSLVLTIIVVVAMLGLVILVIFLSVTALAQDLPQYLDDGSSDTSSSETTTTDTETSDLSTTDTDTDTSSTSSTSTSSGLQEIIERVIESVVNLLVQFGWALVIFFFMISAAISLPTPSRLGLDPNAPAVGRLSSITEDVRKYMTVLTGINFLVGLGDMIFLLILGVDYAILWGLLAWFMGYIPSIGFMIALIPPVLLAYAQYGLQTALIVLIGYILINGGVQNFIQPKVMGDRLRISPAVVFIGLFVWGYLLGGIGAILAVPLTVLLLIALENLPGTRNLAILMRYTGDEKKEEREKAASQYRGLFSRLRKSDESEKEPELDEQATEIDLAESQSGEDDQRNNHDEL